MLNHTDKRQIQNLKVNPWIKKLAGQIYITSRLEPKIIKDLQVSIAVAETEIHNWKTEA